MTIERETAAPMFAPASADLEAAADAELDRTLPPPVLRDEAVGLGAVEVL